MTYNAITAKLNNYFKDFPVNATSWSQATDEMRDLARLAKEYYNKHDKGNIEPLDFSLLETPAEWNKYSQIYIRAVVARMSPETRDLFFEERLACLPIV